MENNFYIKYGNNPEFSLKDITSNLTLLKLDENPSISNVYQITLCKMVKCGITQLTNLQR